MPVSDAAANQVANPYTLTHEKIQAVREKSTLSPEKRQHIHYQQPTDTYPAAFHHFVRGRDSLPEYITELFRTQIAIYDDGAMSLWTNWRRHTLSRW